LFRDRLCVVARCGHPLFQDGGALELRSLVAFPWVFVPSGPFKIGFENVLEAAGIHLLGGSTICGSIALLKSLIACSDHLGLLPAHAIPNEIADGRLAVLPISIPEFSRNIAMFIREGDEIDKPSRDLVDEIQRIGAEFSRSPSGQPERPA